MSLQLNSPNCIDNEGNPTQRFNALDSFYISGVLGEGSGGKVHLCSNIYTKEKFAIKSEKITKGSFHQWKRELGILRSLRHDNILPMRGVFESGGSVYMMMDYMEGGDLLDNLHRKKKYTENEARRIMTGILKAVDYCHKSNIVHRDLKPENVLIDRWGEIKVADFGLSTRISRPHSLTTKCGTPSYTAPEILRGEPYGKSVDLWSVGIILFIILSGYHPFPETSDAENNTLIIRGCYSFYEKYWQDISFDAKILVGDLINVIPHRRLTAFEALNSSWSTKSEQNSMHRKTRVKKRSAEHLRSKYEPLRRRLFVENIAC